MSVIINEFEIVTDGPSEQPAATTPATQQETPPTPTLSPLEVRHILRRQAQRQARIYAH